MLYLEQDISDRFQYNFRIHQLLNLMSILNPMNLLYRGWILNKINWKLFIEADFIIVTNFNLFPNKI